MFHKVKAKNFLSWEKLDFEFQDGVTLIEGYNHDDATPEGSGKSAILNALCWGLFGKIPKDAAVNDVIREGTKSCKVEVVLDGYSIIRTRKPNELYMLQGKSKIKGKDAKETQAMIEEKLGLSFDAFCQAIYFAQNYPKKFVSASEVEKAKILSEIQELIIFDKAKKEAHLRLKKAEVDSMLEVKNYERAVEKRGSLVTQLQMVHEHKAAFEQEKAKKIKDLETLSGACLTELTALKQQIAEIDEGTLSVQIRELADLKSTLYERKAQLKAELNVFEDKAKRKKTLEFEALRKEGDLKKKLIKIDEYRNPKDKSCPTCGTLLEKADPSKFETFISGMLEEVRKLDDEIQTQRKEAADIQLVVPEELEAGLQGVERDLRYLEDRQRATEGKLSDLRSLERALDAKAKERDNMEALLSQERSHMPVSFDTKISELEAEIAAQDKEVKSVEKKAKQVKKIMAQLETLKSGFKEVKQHVFGGLLADLTRKANRYLAELFEQPVTIEFSNTGESGEISKIVSKVTIDGTPRPLGLYSGGQFRRIQLAVDLALSDIVAERGTNPVRLRILDEYFKDLSEQSMEKILHLLESLKGSTILIEHNSMFKAIVNNTFKVELTNGVSRAA